MRGSCLCGGVAFEVTGARPTALFCHCSRCRAWSGHYWASTRARETDLRMLSEGALRWYREPGRAERGFCGTCGSSLFFRPDGAGAIGIAAGCLHEPTRLAPGKHIFCAEAGDYYRLPDDAPHRAD